jgi:hypothetical protein
MQQKCFKVSCDMQPIALHCNNISIMKIFDGPILRCGLYIRLLRNRSGVRILRRCMQHCTQHCIPHYMTVYIVSGCFVFIISMYLQKMYLSIFMSFAWFPWYKLCLDWN